ISGFDSGARALSPAERRALKEVPLVDADLIDELQLGRTEGKGESISEAIQRPALNLRGIRGGDVGAAATNSIPTEATASIDFRPVPEQTPESVRAALETHVAAHGFFIVRNAPEARGRRAHPPDATMP